jgi:hypothetical protein
MAEGYKNWAAGDTLTAADLEDYTVMQSLMRFASAAARNSAINSGEGFPSLLLDTNCIGIGNGGSNEWSSIGPVYGAWISYTPTWTQAATITKTITRATYMRVGRMVNAHFYMTATSAGTAANTILMGIPVAAVTGASLIGHVDLFDVSGGLHTTGAAVLSTASTFGIQTQGATGLAVAPTIASGDIVSAMLTYEAAADA